LRFESFEPKAKGIRAMLPYVDDFKAAHNLKSLIELADLLSKQSSKQAYTPPEFMEHVA